jgi:hypothetical protein
MTPPPTDWSAQQEAVRQRSIAGGGKPGLAHMEQIAGKSGREILEAMMSEYQVRSLSGKRGSHNPAENSLMQPARCCPH